MADRGTGTSFETTNWTVVSGAARDPASFEQFVIAYWPPVYAFLRRARRSAEDAADLTQSFFATLLEDPRLLLAADRTRGRFRSYLLAALKNFLIDEHRREYGRHAARRRPIAFDQSIMAQLEAVDDVDPAAAFDRQWAVMVLGMGVERLETASRRDGLDAQWQVFEERVLRPASRGLKPAPTEQMMAELGTTSPQVVYSMVQTMKRRLHRELLNVVAETLDDPAHARDELATLLKLLSQR